MRIKCLSFLCLAALLPLLSVKESAASGRRCTPTPWDEIGPFYRPNAPIRSSIGKGYLVTGTVRSSADCAPIPKARIEFWHAGPAGTYDDAHRATVIADDLGRYRLETSVPSGYAQRPPHIHILVDAKGFEGVVTQHYPKLRARGATLDLVLVPESGAAEGGRGGAEDLVRPGRQQR